MNYNLFTISVLGFIKRTYEVHKNDVLCYIARPRGLFSASYRLYNANDQLLLDINFKQFTFDRRIEVIDVDGLAGSIRKKIFSNAYVIDSYNGNYRIHGNFWSTEFDIFYNEEPIAKASRKRFVRKNSFGMALKEGVDEDFVVSMLISILIFRSRKRNSG